MKAGETVVVLNYKEELLAVKIVEIQSLVAGIRVHVEEPDGSKFWVYSDRLVRLTNRYTIQKLEDLLETMKIGRQVTFTKTGEQIR